MCSAAAYLATRTRYLAFWEQLSKTKYVALTGLDLNVHCIRVFSTWEDKFQLVGQAKGVRELMGDHMHCGEGRNVSIEQYERIHVEITIREIL